MRETDFVSGFARGLKVIEAFGETRQRLSIAEASKLTDLDRATVRRSLLTLAELGYADYDGKFFTLTPKILRLGHAYLAATPLPALLQPHLDLLSERAGQSASASVLDGTEIVYIARAAQRRVMSINLTPGSRLSAYCASMGRVLLAALSESEARASLPAANSGRTRSIQGPTRRSSLPNSAACAPKATPSSTRSWRSASARSPCLWKTTAATRSRRSISARRPPSFRPPR